MKLKLYISLMLSVLLCVGCTEEQTSSNSYITQWMDEILEDYYLYNEEYKTLSRDLTTSYSLFLDATLLKMKTNELDNKDGEIYSFVSRQASTKSSDTRISTSKYLSTTLGLASAGVVTISMSTRVELAIYAVYADSPLYNAGVGRGSFISKINGVTLTQSNYATYANMIIYPTAGESYSLTIDGKEENIIAQNIYCSPILVKEVWEVDSKKVGYLSYLSFDAAYDSELIAALTSFTYDGVSDMILDMRLNGGGYVDTANTLSTAIAGVACSGEVFTYYTYNSLRGGKTVEFKTPQSGYSLGLQRLYCLVSGSTASASELVINSLRGIDIDVILIGETTEGKNVAMDVFTESYGSYDYTFYPVTIALTNAKGDGDYADGFDVDYERDDWYNGYNFADFTQDEVMIWTALDLIKGGTGAPTYSVTSTTRLSNETLTRGQTISAVGVKRGNLVVSN